MHVVEASLVMGQPARDVFVRHRRIDLRDEDLRGERIRPYATGEEPTDRPWPNVVILMIDGVRHAHLGVGGGPSGVTPNLDALARQSVVFQRAYTTSTHSDYAQTSFLSGLHPRKFRGHDYFTDDYPRALIWDVLQPLGYRTAVFSTHNERWGDMLRFLKTPRVDVFRHAPDWPDAPRKGHGNDTAVPEEVAVRAWQRWRDKHPGRHLSYLNFQVTHFPYALPPGAKRPYQPDRGAFHISFVRYPREAVPVMKNRFFNALHEADRWVGEVVADIRRRGEWDKTAIIVASDHGEAFYEHEQPTHGTSLYEEQVQSVLIMRLPGTPTATVDDPVSLLDVMPTLLDAMQLPPHPAMQGTSVLPDPPDSGRPPRNDEDAPRFFTIQGLASMDGVVAGRWKVVMDIGRRQLQCFDLAEDPGEKRNLWRGERGPCGDAARQLWAFLDRQLGYYDRKLWRAGYFPPPTAP